MSEVSERYQRQTILPGIGSEGQQKLLQSRVLLIGAGGLGSPAALYLASAGVGCIGIAERDVVEWSNLHRQILFHETDVGRSKLEVARKRLYDLNRQVRVEMIEGGIRPDNACEVVARYDLVLDGSDNFGTRYLVNDACRLQGIPLIHGGIDRFSGMVTLLNANADTPCYRCLFPNPPAPGKIRNCAEAGVLGPLPGIVGSVMAMEALKYILGIGESLSGKIATYDALTAQSRLVRIKRSVHCPLCGENPKIRSIRAEVYQLLDTGCVIKNSIMEEITVNELVERLKQQPAPVLLDVREDDEVAFCALKDIVHIPLGEISERWQQLDPQQDIVVYCHHGRRSLMATRFLREKGFSRAVSLKGGIDEWSREIDATVPRY
jgi:molybdopterin/thiamine biosynthesis adenylyltransferase/rhodanese-related sulfurtransferase